MKIHGAFKRILTSRPGRAIRRFVERRRIYNFTESCHGPATRRALVSYLVRPLLAPPAFRDRVMFSNRGIAQEIVHALNALGYAVDIVNFDNSSWVPSLPYDLFVGHGGHQFLSHSRTTRGPKLYFSTGSYWRIANSREADRLHQLTARTGHLLPPDRVVSEDEEAANRAADAIICLGNQAAASTYATFPRVAHINNAVYSLPYSVIKSHATSRNSFLFFAGRGNVHKGLDLLLESFHRLDATLHVCQHLEADFLSAYQPLLATMNNVHMHGFVEMRSKHFREVAQACSWVILPTCSEGQPGSVLECMSHGLIPVLPDTAHIDLGDFGIRIADCSVEGIGSAVADCLSLSQEECTRRTSSIAQTIAVDYSPATFRSSFAAAVRSCLSALDVAHSPLAPHGEDSH